MTTDNSAKGEVVSVESRLIALSGDATVRRERAVSPVAALFAPGGNPTVLRTMRPKLEALLESLRQKSETFGEKSTEETMLRQVLEWISQTEQP
jgi:hypothetical protein